MTCEILGNYYHGKFEKPPSDRETQILTKVSPADLESQLWECPVDHHDISKVIESSIEGFKLWKKMASSERCQYLQKYKEALVSRKDHIAQTISLETGKPLWEAHTEVNASIGKIDVTIQTSLRRIDEEFYKDIMANTDGRVSYKPIGPCLVLGPFNFPCHLANGQILNALAAGNSIIFKPSEKTILSGQLLIECFHQAGFPKGVINLINGAGDLAGRIVKEKSIKGIFFTGSKEVGLKILSHTYKDLNKLVALEMGGKNTTIIHSDANLDIALPELIKAAFLTTGQRCVATSKVAIHRSVMNKFIENFHHLSKKIIIDHPIDHEKEPFMGPLIDEKSTDNYLNYMGMAIREGAEEIMRGKVLDRKYQGHYVSPSLHYVDKINDKSHFLTSEIFGPNVTFIPYDELEEAIDIANHGPYGLASAVFTNSKENFKKCVEDIDAGIINHNRSTAGASGKLPFGGIKNSGNHRPAGVSMIDACVYPVSSLEIEDNIDVESLGGLKGIMD